MSISHKNGQIRLPPHFELGGTTRIRKFLTSKSTEMLVHAFISFKLDYCNSLFYGVPKFQLQKLQHVQNAAARLITLSILRWC